MKASAINLSGGSDVLQCDNGHDQPDNAKFCGICGSRMNGTAVSPAAEPADSDDDALGGDSIDLDVMDTDDGAEDVVDDSLLQDDDDGADADDADGSNGDASDEQQDDDQIDVVLDGDDFQVSPALDPDGAIQRLHLWARANDLEEDPYVDGLISAVRRRDDLSMWASLNPLDMLPTPRVSAGSTARRLADFFAIVRNVLVFVPVLLTWLAIGRAVEAFGKFEKLYAETITEGETKDLNFLLFWHDPDGYRPPGGASGLGEGLLAHHWRIGDIAVLDAWIVGVIIVLTLLANVLRTFSERRAAASEGRLMNDRLTVALAVADGMHGKRHATPDSIEESLAESLNDLTQAARDVNEAAARMERASGVVGTMTPHLESLNEQVQRLAEATSSQVSRAMGELVSSVQGLNDSVSGSVTAVFGNAVSSLEEVGNQLSRVAASVEYGVKQLRDDLDALGGQSRQGGRGGRSS
jgi:hypothetical protein